MAVETPVRPVTPPAPRPQPRRTARSRVVAAWSGNLTGRAVRLLQVFALTLMIFPSDLIFKAVGAAGYVAGLVGMAIFAAWAGATLLGHHDPLERRNPVRSSLALLWIVSLVSYVVLHRYEQPGPTVLSADRWIMQLVTCTGVAVVAAECLPSVAAIRKVVRALVWGGAFCGVVASLQFWIGMDVTPWLRTLPGFQVNGDGSGIIARASLRRVSGTAIHPIELGVVAAMILPLAIWLAVYDTERTPGRRKAAVLLVGASVPASVSRSGVLGLAVALLMLFVLLPPRMRVAGMSFLPIGILGVFMTSHGLISTLTGFFTAGNSDPSISHRTDTYPMVEKLVAKSPLFGSGGGTYQANLETESSGGHVILDNLYLKTAIELGLLGLVILIIVLVTPVAASLSARRRTEDEELRSLCSCLAAAAAAGLICPVAFDAFSFPMFTCVEFLVAGLAGAAWLLSRSPAYATAGRRPLDRTMLRAF